jgi:hypothetical protein
MPHDRPPEPWHSFFAEIDQTLDQRVALHCIGGFAIAMLYGLPRPTVDVDCLTVIPVEKTAPLHSLAGEGSALHKRYGVYLQHVGIVTVPENYNDRMTLMFPTASAGSCCWGWRHTTSRYRKWNGTRPAIEKTSSISPARRRSTFRFWKAVISRSSDHTSRTRKGTT